MESQKGFAPILIILLVLLFGAVGYFVYVTNSELLEPVVPQTSPMRTQIPTTPTSSSNQISQLTKEQVLNGYNQCGQQFKDGELNEFGTDYKKYDAWDLERRNEGKESCDFHAYLSDVIVFADLDNDAVFEAVVSANMCGIANCHGFGVFVFKNIDGIARVADEVVVNGGMQAQPMQNVSVDGGSIILEWNEYSPAYGHDIAKTKTLQFLNGKIVKE